MKEDQPVKCGHRAILQRFTIAIARYIFCAVLFTVHHLLPGSFHHNHQIPIKKGDGDSGFWRVAKVGGDHCSKVQDIDNIFSDTFSIQICGASGCRRASQVNCLIIFQLKIPYLRSILIFLSRSFMDMWILFYSFPAIAVTRVEDRDKPILGTIFR